MLEFTKKDLKRLVVIGEEIEHQNRKIAKLEKKLYQYSENRPRSADTIMMSSTDVSCRVVKSQVVASAPPSQEEKRTKQEIIKTCHERDVLREEYDKMETEIKMWLASLDNRIVREILQGRYIERLSVAEVAKRLSYEEGSIRNKEALFWKDKKNK